LTSYTLTNGSVFALIFNGVTPPSTLNINLTYDSSYKLESIYVPCESIELYKAKLDYRLANIVKCLEEHPILYRYYNGVKQMSFNDGETWVKCYPQISRTVTTSGYVCVGYDKYEEKMVQISTDNGVTWEDTGQLERGNLIESNSADCGYVPPTPPTPADYSKQCLTFEAIDDCSFKFSGRTTAHTVSYSLDSGATWNVPSANTQSIRYVNVQAGNKVMWKEHFYAAAGGKIGQFSVTNGGRFNIEGNIMSLYNEDNYSGATTITQSNYFQDLFSGCTTLIYATNLVLPATNLSSTYYCYQRMFKGCTAMVTSPKTLPAMNLGVDSYSQMFSGCTSLTAAPELPATTLTSGCYDYMFNSCSSLNYIKALFTTTPSSTYMSNWVNGVASSGTFVKNSEATWTSSCGVSTYPCNWTITDNSN
jgi:hypothetical protein